MHVVSRELMAMLYVLPLEFTIDETSYPQPVETKLASPQVLSMAPEAVVFPLGWAQPTCESSWKATICFAPAARVKLSAGDVIAMQEPRLASTVPEELVAALFQTTMVMDSPEVFSKVFVNWYPLVESTKIMLEPSGEPMFPIFPTTEPEDSVAVPNSDKLFARPTMSLKRVVASEIMLAALVLAAAVVAAATGATDVVVGTAAAMMGEALWVATGAAAVVDVC